MGEVTASWEAHHRLLRRPARAQGIPEWCPCNIVGLHARCHTQGPFAVHDHPEQARERGLMLRAGEDPRRVLLARFDWILAGPAWLNCHGLAVSTLWTPEEVSRVSLAEASL